MRWDLNCAFPWWLKMGNTSPHFYWNFCRNSFSRYKEAKRKTACNVLLLFFFNENFKDTDKLTWGLNRTIVNYAQRCLTIVNYNKGNDGNILCLYRGYDWIRTFRKINADTLKSLTCKLHFFFQRLKFSLRIFTLQVCWKFPDVNDASFFFSWQLRSVKTLGKICKLFSIRVWSLKAIFRPENTGCPSLIAGLGRAQLSSCICFSSPCSAV